MGAGGGSKAVFALTLALLLLLLCVPTKLASLLPKYAGVATLLSRVFIDATTGFSTPYTSMAASHLGAIRFPVELSGAFADRLQQGLD